MFLGQDEDWDVMAVVQYPNLKSFLGVYADEDYRSVFHHRTAACLRQKVLVGT